MRLASLSDRDALGGADDLRDSNSEVIFYHNDFAFSYQPAIHHQVERLAGHTLELDDRAGGQVEHILDQHPHPAQLHGDVKRDVHDETDPVWEMIRRATGWPGGPERNRFE